VIHASAAAADSLHVSMSRALEGKLHDGGIRTDAKTGVGEEQGALTGSILSRVPVVLIEMVSLTNAHDAEFITSPSGVSLMAQAIANGIGRYAPASNSPRTR
jgi:N-acetylmuramoyl-L-alanine amidase